MTNNIMQRYFKNIRLLSRKKIQMILDKNKENLLNKRKELMSKCRGK